MAQAKIVITDDEGTIIGMHEYELKKGMSRLSEMEIEIEQLRPQILGDVMKDLLENEQESYEKKQNFRGEEVMK